VRELVEAGEIERHSEVVPNDGFDDGVERLDLDAARSGLDSNLAPADDAVHAALVPEVGEVRSERAVARRREREVERLRKRELQRRGTNARTADTDARPSRPRATATTWTRSRRRKSAGDRNARYGGESSTATRVQRVDLSRRTANATLTGARPAFAATRT
jgi:hypothetical protein